MTRLQYKVARGRQNPVDTALMWGQWYLSGRRLLKMVILLRYFTGCLEIINIQIYSSDCTILAIICVPGTSYSDGLPQKTISPESNKPFSEFGP
ncbi:hypothetical protein TNCV_1493461 [Trichonephila clavipes]|nr:hypothetical protein TNCV_1493461 [Trichonephila clavipes]